jgi:hypothetical protein
VLQILGWALIWWAAAAGVDGVTRLWDAIYFSGVVFLTVGFGDIAPVEVAPRVLVLVEALSGLTLIALVIGYLPTLYGAFSRREHELLLLDDGSEARLTPLSLLQEHAPGGDVARLDGVLAAWERWIAEVLENHSSYPGARLLPLPASWAVVGHGAGADGRRRRHGADAAALRVGTRVPAVPAVGTHVRGDHRAPRCDTVRSRPHHA